MADIESGYGENIPARLAGGARHAAHEKSAPKKSAPQKKHEAAKEPDIELEIPPYPDLKTVFLGCIFFLMLLTIVHTASDLFIPVVLAFIMKPVFQPVQRFLEGIHVPRILAALLVVVMLIGGTAGLATVLSGPSSDWAQRLSDSIPKLQERLNLLVEPVTSAQKIISNAENMTQAPGPKVISVAVEGTRLPDRVFIGTRAFFAGLFTTVVLLFFLLAAGDTFLRRMVEILPRFHDKRQAVEISQAIEQDISKYLMTITLMNAAVGILTGIVMALNGREDPVLWGTLAFLLNYVPIIGPMMGFAVFFLVGLTLNNTIGDAVLPAGLYFAIHLCESTLITPLLLAKRFTLNPVLVILSLIFWYWMWGFLGAVLAMPMLAIVKIVCDRITTFKPLGHFLAG